MNASEQIDQYIAGISDWRGEMLARIRQKELVRAAVAHNAGKK